MERWRQASQDANEKPVLTLREQKELEKLRAQDQREIKRLQKELRKKEKALAEAAALLLAGDGDGVDRRKGSCRNVAHRLSEEERQRILLTCNEPEFAALPPGQIVPVLADRGLYIGSERSFYRVLHTHGQVHRRDSSRGVIFPVSHRIGSIVVAGRSDGLRGV